MVKTKKLLISSWFGVSFFLGCGTVPKSDLSADKIRAPSSPISQPRELLKTANTKPNLAKNWEPYLGKSLQEEWARWQQMTTPVKKWSDRERTFLRLGERSLKEKVGAIALQSFTVCLKINPQNSDCRWGRAWAYYLEHQYALAVVDFEWSHRYDKKRRGNFSTLQKVKALMEKTKEASTVSRIAPLSHRPQRKLAEQTIKIKAVGDIMLGAQQRPGDLPPEDLSILELVRSALAGGDIVYGNYEGSLCEGERSVKCSASNAGSSCFAFRSPPNYVHHLKAAGFNLLSIANNHSMDFGPLCNDQMEDYLETNGIFWSGRRGTVTRFMAKGMPVAMIAFHSAGHANSVFEYQQAAEMIRAEKASGQIVIVSFHGGAEGAAALHLPSPPANEYFYGENRGNVTKFAHVAVDSGADLVLGSGPHVVRAMELYKKRLIAYSLGNFATYKHFNLWGFNGIGLILDLDLAQNGEFRGGRILPTKQIGHGVPVLDEKGLALDLIRLLSIRDIPGNELQIARDGTLGIKPQQNLVAEEWSLSGTNSTSSD